MANIPTISDLYSQILASLEAQYTINIPLVGKNFLRAMAAVQAAKLKLAYLAIGDVQKNIFVDLADPAAQGGTLERFGLVKLGRLPFPATAGIYTIQITGTIGAIIPASSTFKSNDDALSPGFLFVLDSAFILDGIDQIQVRALDAGLDAQLSIGDNLTITSPVALVDSVSIVLTEDTEPQEAEDIEEYREKAIDAYRLEPQGGAASDYRLWSSDAQGVAESYPYARSGYANEVNLYVEATIADSTDGKGTPTVAILAAVESAVEDPTVDRPSRKPLAVYAVNYLPASPQDIDITIPGGSFTAAEQALILGEMTSQISDIRPFIGGIDVVADKNDIFSTNQITSIILAAVPGSSFGAVDLEVASISLATYTFENGEIPFLNSITYI